MLIDASLREFVKPVDFYTQDWPHIFAQHGVGNIQLYHFLESASINISALQDDVVSWKLPAFRKFLQKNLKQVFQPNRRDTKEKYWKCGISEFLRVAPMVLNFVSTKVTYAPDNEIELFAQLCFIIDLIRTMTQVTWA